MRVVASAKPVLSGERLRVGSDPAGKAISEPCGHGATRGQGAAKGEDEDEPALTCEVGDVLGVSTAHDRTRANCAIAVVGVGESEFADVVGL